MENNEIENDELKLDFEDMPDLNLDDVEVAVDENQENVLMQDNPDSDVFDDLVETMMPEKEPLSVEEQVEPEEQAESDKTEEDDYSEETYSDVDIEQNESSNANPAYIPITFGRDANFVEWYSGSADEPIFEVSKNSESGDIIGDDEWQTIHVNVGLDSYGWQVHFASGSIMSIDDVRIYQLRNGELPETDGAIVYGSTRIEFKNIKKITVYKSVRYFTYA